MFQRIIDEVDRLRKKFPDIGVGEQGNWLLVPRFPLPEGRFEQDQTPLLIVIPPGYPNTGPDNFFVRQDLRLIGGSTPPAFNQNSNSSSGPAPVEGSWGWFSWHPHAWRPSAQIEKGDNLETYLRAVNICLRGEEMP